eukprot:s7446_g3.t1
MTIRKSYLSEFLLPCLLPFVIVALGIAGYTYPCVKCGVAEIVAIPGDQVREIVSYLPTQRRTMLFSATMPESVMDVVSKACRGNYRYIDCVGEELFLVSLLMDVVTPPHKPCGERNALKESQSTASTAEQSYVVLNGHQCLAALYNLIMNEMAADRYGYKILVFFATARLTTFMAQFFREQLRMGVYEIHRRRDADARIATQERFKEAQSGILFSSDVSARGMDYPNVTLVLQFGAPATREMYIHRVGRTARAGKSGQAVLILGELESSFLTAVQDLPIRQHERAEELKRVNELIKALFGASASHSGSRPLEPELQATTSWLASAPLRAAASAAFASLLVHYKATHRILHMEDDAVIQAASDLLLGCGLVDQPVISRRLGVMLGLEKNPLIQCARRIGEQDDVLQEQELPGAILRCLVERWVQRSAICVAGSARRARTMRPGRAAHQLCQAGSGHGGSLHASHPCGGRPNLPDLLTNRRPKASDDKGKEASPADKNKEPQRGAEQEAVNEKKQKAAGLIT